MSRVTIGNLWVTIGHLRVTVGHLRVTIGHLRATMDHLRLTSIGYHYLKVTVHGSAKASDISVTVRRGSVTWRLKQGQVWSRNRQLENILMKE